MQHMKFDTKPKVVECFPFGDKTDVYIRKNIERRAEVLESGDKITVYDCDEVYYRYPGPITAAEVKKDTDSWWSYPQRAAEEAAKEQAAGALRAAKAAVLGDLSQDCRQAIVSGVVVETSQGTKTFPADENDQRQVYALAEQSRAAYPLHAVNEPDEYYTRADVLAVKDAMDRHIEAERARYNSLKMWVNDLEDAEAVRAVTYESEIPEKYITQALKDASRREAVKLDERTPAEIATEAAIAAAKQLVEEGRNQIISDLPAVILKVINESFPGRV